MILILECNVKKTHMHQINDFIFFSDKKDVYVKCVILDCKILLRLPPHMIMMPRNVFHSYFLLFCPKLIDRYQ